MISLLQVSRGRGDTGHFRIILMHRMKLIAVSSAGPNNGYVRENSIGGLAYMYKVNGETYLGLTPGHVGPFPTTAKQEETECVRFGL